MAHSAKPALDNANNLTKADPFGSAFAMHQKSE